MVYLREVCRLKRVRPPSFFRWLNLGARKDWVVLVVTRRLLDSTTDTHIDNNNDDFGQAAFRTGVRVVFSDDGTPEGASRLDRNTMLRPTIHLTGATTRFRRFTYCSQSICVPWYMYFLPIAGVVTLQHFECTRPYPPRLGGLRVDLDGMIPGDSWCIGRARCAGTVESVM